MGKIRRGNSRLWLALALVSGACRFGYELEPEAGRAGSSGAGGISNPTQAGAAGSVASAGGDSATGGNRTGGNRTGGNATGGNAMGGNSGSSPGGVMAVGGVSNSAGDSTTLGGSDAGSAGNPSGLIAYLKFDEVSGKQAADATPNQNHGTLVGFSASGWRTGKFGGALSFDGVGNYVTLVSSPSLNRIAENDAYTVAAWVQVADAKPSFQTIGTVQYLSTNEEVLDLTTLNAKPAALVNTQSSTNNSCYASGALPLNTWVHLAGTFDGVTVRAYVDGVEVCRAPSDLSDIPLGTNPFVIGMNQNGSIPGEFLHGALDELLVYDRALSAPELAALAAGSPP